MPKPDESNIGKRLKDLREHLGFSVRGAARLAQLSPTTITRTEKEETKPDANTLKALAELYGVDPETLEPIREIRETPGPYLSGEPEGIVGSVKIIGNISAGGLVESWQEDLGALEIPSYVARQSPHAFALKVTGNSLVSEGILDGDIVIVDPDAELTEGKIYAVRSEEHHQTIAARKVYRAGPGKLKLVAGEGSVVDVDASRTELLGRIIGLGFRRL